MNYLHKKTPVSEEILIKLFPVIMDFELLIKKQPAFAGRFE